MIHVIKTDADYEAALARVEAIFGAEPGSPEFDELEVWGTLIEAYEREHHPIAPPTPLEAIEFAMDQKGLRRQDLVPLLGSKSRVSEILNGKRPLTLAMIRALHKGLGIPANIAARAGSNRAGNFGGALHWFMRYRSAQNGLPCGRFSI